jgi:hypothetical protein
VKSALTDNAPIKASELETKPMWIAGTLVLVGAEIAAIPAGIGIVLYAVGLGQ